MAEANMREVVRRLHTENSEAVLELLEFDYVLTELWRNLENITTASQELYAAVRNLPAIDDESIERVGNVQDRAGRLHAYATQLLGAFREMRGAVNGWNIVEARRPSSKPIRVRDSSPSGDS